MSVFKDLSWFFKQEKKSYIVGILVLIIVAVIVLFPPYAVGIIVDHIDQGTLTGKTLFTWLFLIAFSGFILYGLRYFWRIMIYGAAARLAQNLRNQLYQRFTDHTSDFYNEQRTGDLMAHATNDVQAVEMTAGDGILTLIDSITMGGMVIMMMSVFVSWELTLISLLPMPFMAIITGRYGTLIHQRFSLAQSSFSNLNDKVQESVSGIRLTKSFGIEKAEINDFTEKSDDTVKKNIAVAKIDALFDPTIFFIVGISYFLAISFGGYFVVVDKITIGQLTTFIMYLGNLIWPMLAFGWLFNIVERGHASYDRIQALLNIKPSVVDREDALFTVPQGDISYRIKGFKYHQDEEPVLKEIRFDIKRGSTLGIVGRTGSGKSTLSRLLLREFDLSDGDILIGGHSIYDYRIDSLRQAIGYVPQDHFLFSTTIAENIAFARPESTLEEIRQVAELAYIDRDIMQFPDGYGTIVGERGTTLSGGQKQRISIARALLLNPEILILDDALSAVDAKTEQAILDHLIKLRQGKTTIIASHRISSLSHAELIIVLENGQLVERGAHQQLIAGDGWYKEIYLRQQLEQLLEQGGELNV